MDRIKREREEIENAPKVEVVVGAVGRCSFCGRPVPMAELKEIETVQTPQGSLKRLGCRGCFVWE